MASTYSDRLKLELMETGANANTWGNNTNNNLQTLDAFSAGYLSKDVGGSSNVTLTTANASATAESSNKVLEFTGTLTGNITVFVPQVENNYLVYNNTSGSYTLDVAATGGTGTEISQGGYAWVYCDGTNVSLADLGGNASAIYTGTLDDARLSANVTLNNASTISTGTLPNARLSAIPNSALDNSAITVDGTSVSLGGSIDIIESGTKMLFQQTSAPTGWTKDSTHNNKALRVVTGTASSGGSNSFTNAFNSTKTVSGTTGGSGVTITGSTSGSGVNISGSTAGSGVTITGSTAGHTLAVSEIPSHTHTASGKIHLVGAGGGFDWAGATGTAATRTTNATGGGGSHSHGSGTLAGSSHTHAKGTLSGDSHTHGSGTLAGSSHTHSFSDTFNLDVQYVDLIIATKD